MELQVVSYQGGRERRLRPYHIDGMDTVGAFGDEPFGIKVVNGLYPVAVRISIDGRDIASGQAASLNPRDGVPTFVINPNQTRVFRNWVEHVLGGAALVFTHEEASVAGNVPSAPLANPLGGPNTLAVAVYTGVTSTPAWHKPGWPPVTIPRPPDEIYYREIEEALTDYATRGPSEAERSPKTISISGSGESAVGAGPEVHSTLPPVAEPSRLRLTQVVSVRHVWYSDMVERLNALGEEPPVAQFAALGSTPRRPAEGWVSQTVREPGQKYPRLI